MIVGFQWLLVFFLLSIVGADFNTHVSQEKKISVFIILLHVCYTTDQCCND